MPLILALALLGPPDEGRFFQKGETDFWGTRRAPPAPAWPESIPPPIRNLLERPSRDNASRYLEWQKRRTGQLLAALRALEEAKGGRVLLYFTQPGCPFCIEQDKALSPLKGLRVERVTDPELWRKYRVTSTPTLVLDDGQGSPRIWRGFTPQDRLEKELNDADRRPDPPDARPLRTAETRGQTGHLRTRP